MDETTNGRIGPRLMVKGAPKFGVQIKGLERFQDKLNSAIDNNPDVTYKAMYKEAKMFRNALRTALHRGPATGKPRAKGGFSSAPGEAPMSDSGDLAKFIDLVDSKNGLGVDVVIRMAYAKYLEFGNARIEERPFIRPTYAANREKMSQNIIKNIFRSIQKELTK